MSKEPRRRLNHVEMVYRPGERALATRVFELLGMRVVDRGGRWMLVLADPTVADVSNNALYASEVTPEQWALEETLAHAIDETGDGGDHIRTAAHAYLGRLQAEPQSSFHFGIRYYERDDFDTTLDRIRDIATDPVLGGRVELLAVYLPDEPGAYAPNMIQAFMRTDVVAAGLFAFAQHIELQWHLPEPRAVVNHRASAEST